MTSSPATGSALLTTEQASFFAQGFESMVSGVEQVLFGKAHVIRLALTCLVSGGHLLLEDYPGTGKTSLARALAQIVDGKVGRIQFTPDLLPADVTGMSVYDQSKGVFEFHPGPVFANIVLADEINRASPKTQNPVEQAGTYRLPEAQLDRFLMKTSLGYPDSSTTRQILRNAHVRAHDVELDSVLDTRQVRELQAMVKLVHLDDAVLDYITRLVEATRQAEEVRLGVSVRGALALVRCASTWALVNGRGYVIPDDIKTLASVVLAHRLVLDPEAEFDGVDAVSVVGRVLLDVQPPAQGWA
jgi:MoxR-like ATPase